MDTEEEKRVIFPIKHLQDTLQLILPVTHVGVGDDEMISIGYDAEAQCHQLYLPFSVAEQPLGHLGDIAQLLCYFKLFEDVDPNFAYPYFSNMHLNAKGNDRAVFEDRKTKFLHIWKLLVGVWATDIQFYHWQGLVKQQQLRFVTHLRTLSDQKQTHVLRSYPIIVAFIQFLLRQERLVLPPIDTRFVRQDLSKEINLAIDDIVNYCRCIPRLPRNPISARLTLERWAQELCRKFGIRAVPYLRQEHGMYVWVLLSDANLLFYRKKI